MQSVLIQGCALAEPGGPWRLTFALGRLENLRFFIQIICWAPWILQFQSTGLPSIFLRAQPCNLLQSLPIRAILYFLLFLCYSNVLRGRISVSLSLAAVHNVWVLINFLTQLLASVSSKSQPVTPRIIIGDAIVFSALMSWYSIAEVQE